MLYIKLAVPEKVITILLDVLSLCTCNVYNTLCSVWHLPTYGSNNTRVSGNNINK